jgi:DNA (cytosine-5)-methyltransferase 1
MREDKIMLRANTAEKELFDYAAKIRGLPIASWARSELLRIASDTTKAPQVALSVLAEPDRPLLSLFCGPGGLDEGFRQAGFTTSAAFDIDQECVNTFNRNHCPPTPSHKNIAFKEDLKDLTPEKIFALVGTEFSPIGVIGGPPCQSFSVSNVHQSEDDPRHDLPACYAKLLKRLNKRNPISFFLFENVPGLLGDRHRHRYEQFKKLFKDAGFEIFEERLNAMDYGVPQDRDRIFIIGINRELHTHAEWVSPQKERRRRTVRETIAGLPEPIFNEKGLPSNDIPIHPNHWTMVPRSKKFTTPGALEEGQAWGRSFRTLVWDEPSWTVAYGNREIHVHPKGHRRLSIYEAMLLQSFPKRYVLTGNISAQVRLVSEAVAPRMAWYLATRIRQCLEL